MLLRLCLYLRVPPVVVQGTSVPGFVHLHLFVIGDLDVVVVLVMGLVVTLVLLLFPRMGLFNLARTASEFFSNCVLLRTL